MSYIKTTLLVSLVSLRIYLALHGIISDCDETFNYWEPLNLLVRGFGKQTWEYSPEYSIRSWVFLIPLAILAYPLKFILSHVQLFYALRLCIVAFSVVSDWKLYQSLNKLNYKISYWFLLFTIVAPGMSHSSISLLPSSFAMDCITLSLSFILEYLRTGELMICYKFIFWFSVGGLTGWPFILVLAVPILIYIVIDNFESNKLTLVKFISGSAFIFTTVLSFITYIDSVLYNKLSIVPLNAILYNVFNKDEATGPNIFGVEPISYYVLNLLLNFNIVAILAYASLLILPLLNLVSGNSTNVLGQNSKLITLISPLAIWTMIFFKQPHKEERFLYPIYPLILMSASILITKIFDILKLCLQKLIKYKKLARLIQYALTGVTIFLISTVSLLRVFSLVQNYSSPLTVYSHIPTTDSNTNSNVCVGREWYHYPNSFFLNSNQRLKFVKSGFNGILPGDFKESSSVFDSISAFPANMNNKNLFETDKIVPFKDCDYYIDIDKDVDVEAMEVQLFQSHSKDNGDELQVDSNWDLIYCDKFIDVDNSYGLGRIFYIPKCLHGYFNTHVEYFHYCLVAKKG